VGDAAGETAMAMLLSLQTTSPSFESIRWRKRIEQQ
jgi:hypothetical protein